MNADIRGRICCTLIAVPVLGVTSLVHADGFPTELGAEIERRFTAPVGDSQHDKIIDSAFPLTREIGESRDGIQRLELNFEYKVSAPQDRLEGVDALPQRTLVERSIEKGFPTGEVRQSRCNRTRDFSNLVAQAAFTFGGVTFNR